MKNSELALAWIRLQRAQEGSDEHSTNLWAAGEMLVSCLTKPEVAFHYVTQIFELSCDPWVHENLGAGPLETLFARHPDVAVALVSKYLLKHSNFSMVVKHVWADNLSMDVALKLKAMSGQ